MTNESLTLPRKAVMLIPPPLVYVAAFAAGLLVQRVVPIHVDLAEGGWIDRAMSVIAGATILFGLVLGPLNAIRFLVRRTTLNPNKQPSVFLTEGIYRVSRNPMYLGLFLIYVGVAILHRVAWPLVTTAVPFLLLDRIVIPFAESQMADRYGASYADYCSRVRRWLTVSRSP